MLQSVSGRVIGRVQGVGFRYYTVHAAEFSGTVTGWVRNADDGSVEFLAEGERNVLDIFLQKVRQGPPLSRVEDILVSWSEIPERRYGDFDIEA